MTAALGVLATTLVVSLLLAAVASGGVSVAWFLLRARIARWHAVDRGRIVGALLAAPVAAPALLLLVTLGPGVLGLVLPALDHCPLHPEHLHLCLVHATDILPAPLVYALAATLSIACAFGLRTLGRNAIQTRPLDALSKQTTRDLSARIGQVETERPIACTYGLLQPRALVSTGLLNGLSPAQAAAVVAHESEHIRRRDPLRLLLAHLASCALWPSVRREMLAALTLSTEQACDERAADEVGDRVLVAETILAVERVLGRSSRAPAPATARIDGGPLALRVESLLAAPRRRAKSGLALAAGVSLLTFFAARTLHHEMEHLLSWTLGVG